MANHYWLGMCLAALSLHAFEAPAQSNDERRRRGDVTCVTQLGDLEVEGNLQVPGSCTLNGTEIRGNVTLFSGGSLTARSGRIRGNLEGSRANFVDLERTQIDGNVQLDGLVGDLSTIELTDVHGDVELTANRTRLEILNNDLGGSLLAMSNTGGVLISGNFIEHDLRCESNSPAPTGIGNRVDDAETGQCADLRLDAQPPAPAPTPPPASTPPPAATPPPASTTPPATPPATDVALDDGGAGAMGWLTLLLAPLVLVRRKLTRR